ncbi:MAG: tyrosine-type recombinase/integrase [Anaerolineae bacterium]
MDKVQTHELTADARRAAESLHRRRRRAAMGKLLRASTTTGGRQLTTAGMSERAITERVRFLGSLAGIDGLSAHDLRHTWATSAARAGTPIDRLMDAGGWSSPAMPLRYIETSKIANEGVRLEV